jgi:hypothetical protein
VCELLVEGHERVRLEQRERDVLRVVGLRPPELSGDLPGPPPEHRVAEKAYRHAVDACEPVASDLFRDVAAVHRLVKCGQHLRPQECRCEELVLTGDLDLLTHEAQNGSAVHDVSGHRPHASPLGLGTRPLHER